MPTESFASPAGVTKSAIWPPHYQHGWSAEELLRQHPDLRPEEVYSALTYFYDHYDKLVAELKANAAAAEAQRPPHGLSREELLKRTPTHRLFHA